MIITPIRCACFTCENRRAALRMGHAETVAKDLIEVGNDMRPSLFPLEALSAYRGIDVEAVFPTPKLHHEIDVLFVLPRADA